MRIVDNLTMFDVCEVIDGECFEWQGRLYIKGPYHEEDRLVPVTCLTDGQTGEMGPNVKVRPVQAHLVVSRGA